MAHGESALAYRLMLLEYRLRDLLRIDPPEPHLAKAPIAAGMTVVDYGCGPGRFLPPLAGKVGPAGKVYAVDIQPLAVQAALDRATRFGLENVEVVLAEGYSSPIPSSCADLVLMLDVFHGIEDRRALLAEIHRLLKPDGRLFMDPGHMALSAATEAVDATGLFRLVKAEGKYILWSPIA